MKITKSDYDRLAVLIRDYVKSSGIKPISDYDITPVRYRWDIFHGLVDKMQYSSVTDYLFVRRLYDYLNDDNMDTALKNILKAR